MRRIHSRAVPPPRSHTGFERSSRSALPAIFALGALLLAATIAFASPVEPPADLESLTERLPTSEGSERVDLLLELAERLGTESKERSLEHAHEALELSRALGDSVRVGQSLLRLSHAHRAACEYDLSLEYALQALVMAEQGRDPAFLIRALNGLGTTHQMLEQYDRASERYREALKVAQETGNRWGEARNLNSLGVNAWYQGDYDEALRSYRASLEVQRDIGDPLGLSAALNNVAMVHHVREEWDEAIDYYEKSLEIKREHGFRSAVAATLGNLGEMYLAMGRFPEARSHLERSRDLAAELNAEGILVNSYYSLAEYHETVGDPDAALRNYRVASEREKEIRSARNAALVTEIQTRYEAEKRNLEIERLGLINEKSARALDAQGRSRNRLVATLAFTVVGLVALGWLYRQRVLAHQRVRAQAEELELAGSKIAALTELLPICATCKMIRDSEGKWHRLETYLKRNADIVFTHGICPDCAATTLGEIE